MASTHCLPRPLQCLASKGPDGVKAPVTLADIPRGTMKEVEIQPKRSVLLVHVRWRGDSGGIGGLQGGQRLRCAQL